MSAISLDAAAVSYSHAQIAGWMDEYGESLYLLRLDQFQANCHGLRQLLLRYHPRVRLGYSYKTNYTPAICRRAHQIGCYAEVVSRMELDLAVRLGVPGRDILFNGPVKSIDDLRQAVALGAAIHVDNPEELRTRDAWLPRNGPPARLALRCNFPLTPDHRSRFGWEVESGAAESALRQLQADSRCRLVGLHCHFSHHRDAESYRTRARKLCELAQAWGGAEPFEYLDIGGGLAGPMSPELLQQFRVPPPTYAEYAAAIGEEFRAVFGGEGPELILEPGMGVIANCLRFAARVTSLKTIGDRRFAATTGSVYNIKPTMNALNLPVQVLRPHGEQNRGGPPTDLVGFTCMEVDVMYRGLEESVDVGDIVVFDNVGAYTTVLLPPFIRPAPAILEVSGAGAQLVRRGQTLDDVLAGYVS